MGVEIERKFLVRGETWRALAHASIAMAQGYLNDAASVDAGAMRASVRVRLEGEAARLNIKSRDLGTTRQEFEYAIPVEDARALLALCVGGRVEKRRHLVRHAGHLWEIDEFSGANAGLLVAEIELDNERESFERPDWLGVEVTMLQRYYNLALASHPFSLWSEDERRPVETQG